MDFDKPAIEPPPFAQTSVTRVPGQRVRNRTWLWLAAIFILGGGVYLWSRHAASVKPPQVRPSVPVSASAARKGDLPIYLSQIGTVTPFATVTVKSRVAGQILKVAFKEGEMLEPGQPLFTIDPSPYEAQLEQYKGQLARDQATLANAKITRERYQILLRQDVIAQQDLDNQQALYDQARGAIENDKGLIAAVEVNLGYCQVVSPIRGRAGLRQVDLGNYVQTTDALLVIAQLQPISVIFSVSEDNLPAIVKDMDDDRRVPVQAWNRDFSHQLSDGFLLTFDNEIDQSTGTVKLRAQFANDDYGMFPNQFVNARVLLKTLGETTLIPSAAVQQTQHGAYLYVVRANQTVARREVTVSAVQGDVTAITSGVSPGELVVTDGLDKLQPGSAVTVQMDKSAPASATASG
jgi:multidrug efflux system membrane fusion protein